MNPFYLFLGGLLLGVSIGLVVGFILGGWSEQDKSSHWGRKSWTRK